MRTGHIIYTYKFDIKGCCDGSLLLIAMVFFCAIVWLGVNTALGWGRHLLANAMHIRHYHVRLPFNSGFSAQLLGTVQ